MFAAKDTLFTRPSGYQISRSVRLRSSASAYLNRTAGTPTNDKIFTFSVWAKRGALGVESQILSAGASVSDQFFFQNSTDVLKVYMGADVLVTSQVFRDPSAWYHIVLAVDTTQATASNRVKLYLNGTQITAFSSTAYPTQNYSPKFNALSSVLNIGRYQAGASGYFDGYMTEINFIDGQALTPSSFGETNAITGVWQPKKYAGTYGTNGFYLNFSDNSGATATTIGKDNSGNGNNWTPNNISVTAGVTYDSMLDVPTLYADGGNGRGNYAVVNPLSKGTSQTSVIDGNLYAIPISGASNWGTVFSSIAIPTSGKWYIEATAQVYAGSGNSSSFGVVDATSFIPTNTAILYQYTTGEGFDGILANLFSDYVSPISDGVQGTNVTGLTGTSINLMLALDVDNGKVYAGYNGTWLNSGNPAGGTGEVASRTFSANDVVAGHTSWNGTNDQSQYYNFGQRPFSYTPPTGFVALNTQNLPAPTISNGASYMAATLWTGTGATQSISNAVNGVSFQPDFVWIKQRSTTRDHRLNDSVRGANKQLFSNTTGAETSNTDELTAFNSNGFTLSTSAGVNASAGTYVGWQWNAGGSTVTNTSGSISAQVRANPTAGFSVVTYTGTGNNLTVGHGLGVAPSMVIFKNRGASAYWAVYHSALGSSKKIYLNDTQTPDTATNWCLPNSTTLAINDSSNNVNAVSNTYVAYCFAAVAGYSAFGSYTGNGSSDGPFVFLGFRPRWVMIKRTNDVADWVVVDSSRNTYNVAANQLAPNSSAAETTTAGLYLDLLSNGFKLRGTGGGTNVSGSTYIYACFAENPFKLALAE